ncbi:hypothetical protein U1E44_08190 [Arenibacter sp. GZD96]|uniref:hypothetical protein n=1 Tax=Aurantibrevibacter litoralis TaxID=3106030 RepID=UPI002AFDDBD9|nr:hypothetical protein [Arenibacter sp. GZD-96]MEA1786066.1 hypothetical protein [Arenibacter sp. GZD-96]
MENKTSKYFKYAFDQIVLVFIGILIAENLAPTLKPTCRTGRGGFSKDNMHNLSVDTSLWRARASVV